jgi:hypothetical protein
LRYGIGLFAGFDEVEVSVKVAPSVFKDGKRDIMKAQSQFLL